MGCKFGDELHSGPQCRARIQCCISRVNAGPFSTAHKKKHKKTQVDLWGRHEPQESLKLDLEDGGTWVNKTKLSPDTNLGSV